MQYQKMSVMDVVELIEAMEDKFGVSAAAVAVAAPAAGGGAAAAAEEKTEFNVILKALAIIKSMSLKWFVQSQD